MENILEIRNLSKSFGRRRVINGLSLTVTAGEVFGFLGPNGSGKTTTIKMIMGFLFADAGQILIGGKDLSRDYEGAMAQVGGIVENPEMYGELTGRKNLELYARLHPGVAPGRIDEVLALVGMQARAGEKVKRYSLGMKQRIGLAQALVHRPRLLILDEPTNGLDPTGIMELRTILKKLAHEEGVAVMVSSHILSEMQQMCDRVGILANGSLAGTSSIEALSHRSPPPCRITVGDTEAAVAALGEEWSGKLLSRGEDYLEITAAHEEIPTLLRLLCAAGIDVYGVAHTQSTLEKAFLDITGGGMNIE